MKIVVSREWLKEKMILSNSRTFDVVDIHYDPEGHEQFICYYVIDAGNVYYHVKPSSVERVLQN